MPIEKLTPTFSLEEERVRALEGIVPEAFADGQINWDVLRELVGERLDGEGREAEHFGLYWPGKREARRLASIPSKGTLVPAPGEGIDEETTDNILIEGDNLEVLKLLQKAYSGRVKMIYIDPPYNTGQDFIYKDDYSEPLESYLKKTGQMGEEGELLTTNTKADGRFHTNWLNMMYPRLRLARNLLRDDGVIWISIDDNELMSLRAVCNEIFGEENFVATFIWQKRTTRENRRVFSFNHDYIVCYARDKEIFQTVRNMLPMTEEVLGRYENPDKDPRGEWQSVSLNAQAGHATKSQFYSITTPSGRVLNPPPGRCWAVTKDRMDELIADNRVWFGSSGNNVPRRKVFLSEAKEGLTPHTLWTAEEVGTTDSAKKALIQLFDGKEVFDTPKPVDLIKRIIGISTSTDTEDIVLDFFAGSGTTAQAVLESNKDGGYRRYILSQLPEPTPEGSEARKLRLDTIADIAKARLQRVKKALKKDLSSKLKLDEHKADLGFKVFKLQPSNFKAWQDYHGENLQELEDLFASFESPLVDGWKDQHVLTEVMLLEGFTLSSQLSSAAEFKKNQVTCVESNTIQHRLYVCLDAEIANDTIERVAAQPEKDVFICFDSALTDEAKLRLADVGNVRTI